MEDKSSEDVEREQACVVGGRDWKERESCWG